MPTRSLVCLSPPALIVFSLAIWMSLLRTSCQREQLADLQLLTAMFVTAEMPPGGDVDTLLSQVILRGLGDKLYDKRKAAALEVEQLVKTLAKEVHLQS